MREGARASNTYILRESLTTVLHEVEHRAQAAQRYPLSQYCRLELQKKMLKV